MKNRKERIVELKEALSIIEELEEENKITHWIPLPTKPKK